MFGWRSGWFRFKRVFARKISRNSPWGIKVKNWWRWDKKYSKKKQQQTNGNKIPKFNLKLYALLYDAMNDFPESTF